MHSWFGALFLASLTATSAVEARKISYPPCAGGTYLVQGAPLVLGSNATPVDRLRIAGGQLALGDCSGLVHLKGTKKGTRVRAKLPGCAGGGTLTVTALIAPSCQDLDAKATGKRRHRLKFHASSHCGDGVVDVLRGEQCDPPNGTTCDAQCRSIAVSTTTTTTVPSGGGLEVTPEGSPAGALVTGTVEPTGGVVTDSTTGAIVEAPSGAFAGSTQVGVQPVTNPLESGLGLGVLVTTSTAAEKPIIVRIPYGPEVTNPEALRLAVRLGDGSWQDLYPRAVDTVNHWIAAAIRPPTGSAARRGQRTPPGGRSTIVRYLGFELDPTRATVPVGRHLTFIPYARESEQTCTSEPQTCDASDPVCLTQIVVCDRPVTKRVPFTNDKPGFSRSWSVDDIDGGDGTVGTITPNAVTGATYVAPGSIPSPNTVKVRFTSLNTQTGDFVFPTAPVHTVSGYHVSADYEGHGDALCFCEVADVTDHFDFDLDYGDNGSLKLPETIDNTSSGFTNQRLEPHQNKQHDHCDTRSGFENFDAERVTVIGQLGLSGEPATFTLEIGATVSDATCEETNDLSPVTVTVPSTPTFVDGLMEITFSETDFVNGRHVQLDFSVPRGHGVWTITIDERH